MVTAEIISPTKIKDWRKRGFLNSNEGIFCESCGLDYDDGEYKILYKHKKIGYFFFIDPSQNDRLYILCHDCLFKKIKKLAKGEEFDLLIMDDDNEYTCKFYPHETWDDDDDNFPDFDIDLGK